MTAATERPERGLKRRGRAHAGPPAGLASHRPTLALGPAVPALPEPYTRSAAAQPG